MRCGSLAIVGAGIGMGQLTEDARHYIESSKCLLAVVADLVTLEWLQKINPCTEPLNRFYAKNKSRATTYAEMVDYTLNLLRQGRDVCFVLYGHPGVLTNPSHELLRRTKAEGIQSKMYPGISTEDCLFADLGIDPGACGCQSFEATDFLLYNRIFDPTSVLLLWQFGIIGERSLPLKRRTAGVKILATRLAETYGSGHKVIVYEAPIYTVCKPNALSIALRSLHRSDFSPMSTLYVPPLPMRRCDISMAISVGLKQIGRATISR